MKLTCVTATFNCIKSGNRERLIRCIESVAKLQTEHEHLIYDGASADGTADLLRELEKRTPCLKVMSEPDAGIYNALNKGVRDAKGEWFYVLGADDYICSGATMDNLIGLIEDGVDMVVSTVKRDGGRLYFSKLSNLQNLAYYNCYSHQGVLMRTKWVRLFGGFDELNPVSADYDMFWKAHKKGLRIEYSFSPFAFYSTGGLSSDNELCRRCDAVMMQKHLNLTYDQSLNRRRRSIPFRNALQLFRYEDYAIRCCAKRLIRDRIVFFAKCMLFPMAILKRLVNMRRIRSVSC